MSEIKYININDDRFWQILFDEACVEGKQAERIQNELEQIAVDEKEIIRKPMQDIVEILEEIKKIMLSPKNVDCFGEPCTENDCMACVINKAIEIVKEVGGMDEYRRTSKSKL